ncbi:hypothetical protein EBB59_02440 [Lysobacter pythonis]|uniref:Uncharacterized protein n=1 Tax=Solilutibacter pythonis TaxID=2483112 RepID=A0A3M2I4T8_9GAMM|nr:hypothetical protein EBB59_02440 [Lysobacter pythonis]
MALSGLGLFTGAQAQNSNLGQQASQCFVIYKIAAGLPVNASHKDDLVRLGGLMDRTMQDAGVGKPQFERWTDQLMKRIGTPDKPNRAELARQVRTCNGFAKARYAHYSARK